MSFDTLIVHPHLVDQDGSLSRQTIERLHTGIQIYKAGNTGTLTLTGGLCYRNSIYTNAEAMKRYALSRGLPESRMFLENKGLDAIGQAIFTKTKLVKPNRWKRLLVVSSDYHIPRITEIFRRFYERFYETKFVGVKSGLMKDQQTLESESRSMEYLNREFRDINPEDDERMMARLFEIDRRYKQNPPSTFA